MFLEQLPNEVLQTIVELVADEGRCHRLENKHKLLALTLVNKRLRALALPEIYREIKIEGDVNVWPKLDSFIAAISSNSIGQLVKRLSFTAGASWNNWNRVASAVDINKVQHILRLCENVFDLNMTINGSWHELAGMDLKMRLKKCSLKLDPIANQFTAAIPPVDSLEHFILSQASNLEHLKLAGVLYLPGGRLAPKFKNLRTLDLDCESGIGRYYPDLGEATPHSNLHTLIFTSIPSAPIMLSALASASFVKEMRLEGPFDLAIEKFGDFSDVARLLGKCKQLENFEAACLWFGDAHLEALSDTNIRHLSLLQPLALKPHLLVNKLRDKNWLPHLKSVDVRWRKSAHVSKRKLRESRKLAVKACLLRDIVVKKEVEFFRAWHIDEQEYAEGSDNEEPTLRKSFGYIDREGFHLPHWSPNSPSFSPASPRYSPTSPTFSPTSPFYSPASPTFIPSDLPHLRGDPRFPPTSPMFSPRPPRWLPTSPTFSPSSPHFSPASPQFSPSSPHWSPQSPHFAGASPRLSPSSRSFSPHSPRWPPTSPAFAATAHSFPVNSQLPQARPTWALPAAAGNVPVSTRTYNGYV